MIGLESGRVRLATPSRDAQRLYAKVKPILMDRLKGRPVEHVGSTAVKDLVAKPILDIAVGIHSEADATIVAALLEDIGYRYRGFRSDAGGHVCDWREDQLTTQHVHLAIISSRQWSEYLILRDYLRCSPAARAQYASTKCRLAARFPGDRRAYTTAKADVVRRLVEAAYEQLRLDSPTTIRPRADDLYRLVG